MLPISGQNSSTDVLLSTEAWELERLKAGGCRDSLESILLILRQRGMDFLGKEKQLRQTTRLCKVTEETESSCQQS